MRIALIRTVSVSVSSSVASVRTACKISSLCERAETTVRPTMMEHAALPVDLCLQFHPNVLTTTTMTLLPHLLQKGAAQVLGFCLKHATKSMECLQSSCAPDAIITRTLGRKLVMNILPTSTNVGRHGSEKIKMSRKSNARISARSWVLLTII